MLHRSQTGTGNSNTKYTLTAFGLEDHIYNGAGINLNNKYYYALAGRLVGFNNGSPNFLFTDALGSVVASITTTANSASVKGNQVYGPYGNNPYSKGTMGTTRGYTGHYNDSLTQLDDYGARYYDPLVGVFLSADTVQGNLAGMDPYSYAGENPETNTDPNGEMYAPPGGGQPQGNPPPPSSPPPPPPASTSSGNIFGFIIEGLEQAAQDVEQAIAQNTAEAADEFVRSLISIPEDVVADGGDPFCLPCFALTPLINMLTHPIPLASGTLPSPFTLTVPTQITSLSPQTGGAAGGAAGGSQPPGAGRPPTAPPPDEPNRKAPTDLYRQNRLPDSLHPPIDPVRPGVDIRLDKGTGLCRLDVKQKGISTFTADELQRRGISTNDGAWYKLPKGTTLPEGLNFYQTGPGHWEIGPTSPMGFNDIVQLLYSITGWLPCE